MTPPGPGECLVHDATLGRWLHFREPVAVVAARVPGEVAAALAEVDAAVEGRGLFAAGFVGYEAAPAFDPALTVRPDGDFPLLWFGLYREPRVVALPRPTARGPAISWSASVEPDVYRRTVDRIRRWIADGETYQVNFSYRLRARFTGDAFGLFLRLARAQRAAYAAYVDTGRYAVCSASPELFLQRDGTRVVSRPMKGTRPRAPQFGPDRALAAQLAASVKDRAENVMIVDMVRNDLGRVAEVGSVRVPRLFTVERYPTVWQMTSEVEAETGASLPELIAALFPAASITGAPKPRTMAIIARLEDSPRRVYTGCVGFLAPGRRAQLNVAIRTVLVDRARGLAEYGVGGGIVWDSDAEGELAETRTKVRVLEAEMPAFRLLETLRWTPEEGYFLLDRHLRRLLEAAAYFGFSVDPEVVSRELEAAAGRFPPGPRRVRMLVAEDGKVAVEARPLAQGELEAPARVALALSPVDSSDPFLCHKTTHRDVYRAALASCPGYDDVILWNRRGEVTESCVANLVVEIDGRRYTPPVECGLLAGTYRGWLLERGLVAERVITRDELVHATRVVLVNSVRGEWEVRADLPPARLLDSGRC